MNGRRIAFARRARGALLLAPLLLLAFAMQADAQEAPDDRAATVAKDPPKGLTTLRDLGFDEVRATGSRPVQDFFFPGPGGFALGESSTLTVEFSHSNLLLPQESTVNVALNDRPLRAIALDDSNVDLGVVEIELPRDLIAKDFNKLSLEYAMTLGLECEDPRHPALFATVLPTTRLALVFADDPPVPLLEPPNLSDYPYPFFRGGYPVVAPVVIVVPNNPVASELTAAYRLAANLAARVFFDLKVLDVRLAGTLTESDLREHQLIVLGALARQPLLRDLLPRTAVREQGGVLLREGQPLAREAGLLAIVESPWNPTLRAMLVTGASEEGFIRGVGALTSAEGSALFAGREVVLTEPIIPSTASREFLAAFTVEQLGVPTTTIRGASGKFDISFSAPALAPGGTAQMDLIVSTPQVLDRQRSNVVVELNSEVVQTIELNNSETRRASYRMSLPTDLLRVGQNFLSFRASLYTSDPLFGPCFPGAAERTWITFHSDSAIQLPESGQVSAGADLSSLPFPFAGLLGITETTLVVDPTRPVSLRGGMLAAITIGRRVVARHDLEVVPAQVATPDSIGQRHVVAIGVPQDVPLRAEINQVLPLLFLPDGSRALVEEDETLTEVLGADRLGAIQEAQVPWAPDHRILSLDGTDDTALGWATQALSERGFTGNVALLQSPTRVSTFALERLDIEEIEAELVDRFTAKESRARTLAAFLLIGAGAGILLAIWALRERLPLRF